MAAKRVKGTAEHLKGGEIGRYQVPTRIVEADEQQPSIWTTVAFVAVIIAGILLALAYFNGLLS